MPKPQYDTNNQAKEITIVNSGELGARSDGATLICNRRAGSNDVTKFSSIDYNKKNKIDLYPQGCRDQIAAICLEVDRNSHQKLQQHQGKDFSIANNFEQLIREWVQLEYDTEYQNSEGDSLYTIAFFAKDLEAIEILKKCGARIYDKYQAGDMAEITIDSPTVNSSSLRKTQEIAAVSQSINLAKTITTAETDNTEFRPFNPNKNSQFINDTSIINSEKQLINIVDNSNPNPYDLSNDFNIYTLHQLAAKYSLQKIVQFCLNNQINLDAKDKEGYALLHILAQEGDYKLIRSLTLKVPDINIQDLNNYTPLHWATVGSSNGAVV